MNDKKYGAFRSERDAEENDIARKIVHEIMQFGVSQRQLMLIIHQLAMNLERVEHMQAITATIRELESDTFLIDRADT